MKIIIYHTNIIKIGGVETFTFNLCKQLSKYYDILLIYKNCDKEQLHRLRKYVKCEKYNESKDYECDTCILSSSWGGYPEKIQAKEYIQMIHANYKELLKTGYKYVGWDRTTKHIAVSKTVAENFEEIYKIKCNVIYNILDELKETKPILKLVSATRLSGEKGYNRMVILANKLKQAGIKFRWTIFTNREIYNVQDMNMEEVIYMKPTYDIFDYIKEADYGVQLSDTEGYSYFVNECLQYGTPMLVTNFDSVHESVKDGYNGYIFDMNLNNLDLDKIVNQVPYNFKYEPKCRVEDWIKILGEPEKIENYNYEEEMKLKFKVEALPIFELKNIKDSEVDRVRKTGEQWEVNKERLDILLGDNPYNEPFVKITEEMAEKIAEKVVDKVLEIKETSKEEPTKKVTSKKQVKKK